MIASIADARFSDAALAALFVDNSEPTITEIEEAARDARVYGDVADRLVAQRGLASKTYAHRQEIFGPIVRLMALAGWTLSGSGYFSIAFFKRGLAIKIGLKGDKDAAKSYLQWVMTQPPAPGLPLVHAFGDNQYTYIAVMDRYEPIAGELDDSSPMYEPSIAYEFDEIEEGVERGVSGTTRVSRTAATIHRRFVGEAEFDIHAGNIMLDRNFNLVITDPLGLSSRDAVKDYTKSFAA